MKTKIIKLSDIVIDAGTQQREKINDEIVEEYAEAIKCGAKFPSITAFFDGVQYYLVDGFHRYHAHRIAEIEVIQSDIIDGTRREARLFSAGVNGTHGIRPTNSDKRKAVLVLLTDEEWSQWSDHRIAKHCKVTQPFVSKIRKELITVISDDLKPASNLESENKLSTDNDYVNDSYPQEEPEPQIPEDKILVEKEDYQELVTMLESASKDNEAMTKVFEADDQLGTAAAEIKRLNALVVVLEERMRGFQSAENAAKRAAQMWKTKFEKLEKQVKSAGMVDF